MPVSCTQKMSMLLGIWLDFTSGWFFALVFLKLKSECLRDQNILYFQKSYAVHELLDDCNPQAYKLPYNID